MFIKTRSEILGNNGYDNTYPNISKVYNDVICMAKLSDRIQVLIDLVDTMTRPKFSTTYTDEDFRLITDSMIKIIHEVVNEFYTCYIENNNKIGMQYILFNDKRIGLVSVIDSNYDEEHPFRMFKSKHVFDIQCFADTVTVTDIEKIILDYVNKLVGWISANNYTSRAITWNPDIGRYNELKSKGLNDELANKLIYSALRDASVLARKTSEFTSNVALLEVVI